MNYKIVKVLSSSRNKVCLVRLENGNKAIYKQFTDKRGADREAEVLRRTAVTGYAPKVLEHGDGYLINEYVEGITLYDEFRTATMTDDTQALIKLADMLAIYLQLFYSMNEGYILKEINLKNFIIMDGRCYGIDYERISEGMQYSDIAGAIANALIISVGGALSSLPFVKQLLKNFHLELFDIINEIRGYLDYYATCGKMLDIDELMGDLLALDDKKYDKIRQEG